MKKILDQQQKGFVYIENKLVGQIEHREGLYRFQYDSEYLQKTNSKPISLTLPIRSEAYEQKTMIPFFDGLIPEGWLLDIITDNWKINKSDRMSLLLLSCKDCIGNVSIISEPNQKRENG